MERNLSDLIGQIEITTTNTESITVVASTVAHDTPTSVGGND
jgi:hypothetical protein